MGKQEKNRKIIRSTYLTLIGLVIIVSIFTANNLINAAQISMNSAASAHPFILTLTMILMVGLIVEFGITTIYIKNKKNKSSD